MKFPLLIAIGALAGVLWAAVPSKRRSVGRCEPYAEVCRHCSDCSQCKHCSKDGGKCSVCWTKR